MRRSSWVAAVSIAAIGASSTPASAVPGESIAAFKAGIKSRLGVQTRVVESVQQDTGQREFTVKGRSGGLAWTLDVLADYKGGIDTEAFSASPASDPHVFVPVNHDGTGAAFPIFARVLGAAVAADYRHANLDDTFVSHPTGSPDDDPTDRLTLTEHFYRGAAAGYQAGAGDARHFHSGSIELFTHDGYATALSCQKHPDPTKCGGD